MSTITKEQAQKIIEASDEVITALAGTNEDVHPESDSMLRLWDDLNDRYAPPEVVRELALIALASLEAEPVADERAAFEAFMEGRFKDSIDRKRVKNGDQGYFAWDMIVAWIVWQGRAAMLQGADGTLTNEGTIPGGNSPVIPDGSVLVPVEPTYEMCQAMGLPWESPRFPDRYKAMLAAVKK